MINTYSNSRGLPRISAPSTHARRAWEKVSSMRGQTLLESVIALGAIILVLSATSVAVITSLNNSSFLKQQNQANKYAQQGIEYVRDRISTDSFTNYTILSQGGVTKATQCLSDLSLTTPLSDGECTSANLPTSQPFFKRQVTFTSVTNCGGSSSFSNGLEVVVGVFWTSGKCSSPFCHKQELKTCFLDPAQQGQQPGI